jgi:hypothetical protein
VSLPGKNILYRYQAAATYHIEVFKPALKDYFLTHSSYSVNDFTPIEKY